MSPRWGYEHDAPMGLLICRPDGARALIIHCGLIQVRNSKALQWRDHKKKRASRRVLNFGNKWTHGNASVPRILLKCGVVNEG